MADNIPVFLASDDKYAPFVAITIVSAMENTKSAVDFYILDSGLTEHSKRKIMASAKSYPNCSIEFIRIDGNSFEQLPESDVYISKVTYSRLLIAELKPELKKIIYSDIDVIFLGDIKELFEESLDGEIIGVVQDATFLISDNLYNFQNRLSLPKSHKYFYAGLLLIDIEKWNQENLTQKLMQFGAENRERFTLGDQDLLNMYFGSNYKSLSVKYEATNAYFIHADQFDDMIKNDLKNIVIRHFEGPEKPWNSNTVFGMEMSHIDEFWRYAGKTDFQFGFWKHFLLLAAQRNLIRFLESLYCPIT